MSYANLRLSVDDRVATLTVNRPERLNALDRATIDELGQAIGELVSRADVGAIIVTGAGRAFVAGADIGELAALSPADALDFARRGQAVFAQYEESPKPVIAAVNGFALGGGCELAMACHVRLAATSAKFGQPEVKLGLIPGYGGTQRLPRLVGPGLAAQLLLTGELIDAAEAQRIGLVNRTVPDEELLPTATAMARAMLANAPLALTHALAAMRRGADAGPAERYELEASSFAVLAGTEDRAEGTAAFLSRRPPRFTGR